MDETRRPKWETPVQILLKTEQPLAFAGIWKEQEGEEGGEPHCAIITTEPNGIVGKVHDIICTNDVKLN